MQDNFACLFALWIKLKGEDVFLMGMLRLHIAILFFLTKAPWNTEINILKYGSTELRL